MNKKEFEQLLSRLIELEDMNEDHELRKCEKECKKQIQRLSGKLPDGDKKCIQAINMIKTAQYKQAHDILSASKKKVSSLNYVFLLICLLVGPPTLIYGLYTELPIIDSVNWNSTTAAIQSVWIDKHRKSKKSITGGSINIYFIYIVEVSYEFEVNGMKYTGDTVSFNPKHFLTKEWARDAAKEYQSEKDLQIFYDPSDPTKSVINKGYNASNFVALYVGVLFSAGGLYFLASILIRIRKRKKFWSMIESA